MNDAPKLYVGTYEKYNNGSIAGAWVDLTEYETADDFYTFIKELHKDEDDPEFMYQDYENFPNEMYSESGIDIDALISYAHLDDDDREKVNEYMDASGESYDENTLERAEDTFFCNLNDEKGDSWGMSNEEALGWYVIENGLFGVDIPDALENYIDHEGIGRDWLMDLSTSSNNWVFDLNR